MNKNTKVDGNSSSLEMESTNLGSGNKESKDPLAAPAQKTTFKERWKHPRWLDTIIVATILTYLINLIGQFIPGAFIDSYAEFVVKDTNPELYTILNYFAMIGVWIACILVMVIFKRNRPILKTIKFGWGGNRPKYIIIGVILGFSLNSIVVLVAVVNGSINLTFDKFDILPVIICLIAVFVQSGSEELIFRTYLFRKLRRNYHTPLVPILTSALVFALFHCLNPGFGLIPILNLFFSGLIFALMIYYWNSFWAAAAFHTLWNFTQNIIWGLPNSGHVVPMHIFELSGTSTASFAYDPAFGVEGTILSVIVLVVACAVIIFFGERKKREAAGK